MTHDVTGWHALVIGVDCYPEFGPRAQLGGCVNDATSMRQLLVERVGVAEGRVEHLTAPGGNALAPTEARATAARIREAMRRLRDPSVVRRGDHVVIFLAGHGVRVWRGQAVYYGFAAEDAGPDANSFGNVILDHEINELLSHLSGTNGATVTVIADTCHSGGATRRLDPSNCDGPGPRARGVDVRIDASDEEWSRALRSHPALAGGADHGQATRGERGSGWAGGAERGEWVILSACHDTETAKETTTTVVDADGTVRPVVCGVLSAALFDVLARVPSGALARTRWLDVIDDIQRAVQDRLRTMRGARPWLTPQRPILEGRAEMTLFGGVWSPFAPGFSVRTAHEGALVVNGGLLHGLERGTELAIFDPETADFEEALRRGVIPALARVTAATSATSEAILLRRPEGVEVKDGARARVVRPGPHARKIEVRLMDVPPTIRDAAFAIEDGASFLRARGPDDAAHVEVRRWSGGWAILASDDHGEPAHRRRLVVPSDPGVPATLEDPPVTPENLIAHLPQSAGGTAPPFDDARLGRALGAALAHWARYLSARERRSDDDSLKAALAVKLRVGAGDPSSAIGVVSDALAPCRLPRPDGVHEMLEGEWLKTDLEVLRSPSLQLFVGLVACSDDGNVIPMWPPPGGDPTLQVGDKLHIGLDRIRPAVPVIRADQGSSRYTIKVFAYTAPAGSTPVDLTSAGLRKTVQEIIDGALDPAEPAPSAVRGGLHLAPSTERPTWCVWTLRIVVRRRQAR